MRLALLLASAAFVACDAIAGESTTAEAKAASVKGLELLQNVGNKWQAGCMSCHNQILPMIALGVARGRGVPVNEAHAAAQASKGLAYLRDFDAAVQHYGQIDTAMSDAFALMAHHAAGAPATISTAVYAMNIADRQLPDGHWPTFDMRPPQSDSTVTATAIAIRGVQLYLPERLAAEKRERADRAAQWLAAVTPRNTDEMVFKVLGLKWASADDETIRAAAQPLLQAQRQDGGWSQVNGWQSDAYATGESLYALMDAGVVTASDAAYRNGRRFLLSTQKPDGSWFVATRIHPPAKISPPYFDAGFPYGKDQYSSAAATTWAAMALMMSLDRQNSANPQPVDIAPVNVPAWAETALFGTVDELKTLLDEGLDPNAKTEGGTSVLMMAVRDLGKTKLLVERGADVNAAAKTGYTALLVAAGHRGTTETVRYLITKGASVKPTKVKNRMTPVFLATYAGESGTIDVLAKAGAPVSEVSNLMGAFPMPPTSVAVIHNDVEVLNKLVAHGANPLGADQDGVTQLAYAVIGGRMEMTRRLIELGANVNAVDKFGMTPLLYASAHFHNDAEVVKVLLAAGAKRNFKNKTGETAAALAKKYNHTEIAQVLETRIARNQK